MTGVLQTMSAVLADALSEAGVEAAVAVDDGAVTATVPVTDWREAVRTARAHPGLGFTYFDWLTAVDVGDEGFEAFVQLRDVPRARSVQLRTGVPRFRPAVPSLTPLFPGADWPERETAEMFGIVFSGHPDPRPLLLPDTFDGHPLRKDFVLTSRVARAWPGAHDPAAPPGSGGSAAAGGPARTRRHRPPGVPEPGTWAQPEPPEVE